MLPRPLAVDEEGVRFLDHFAVAVARDVPHDDLVALLDRLTAQRDVGKGGAPHMRERRLPANDLRHHVRDQIRIGAQLLVLARVLIKREHAARDRIARRVVAADDEQNDVPQILVRRHIPRRIAVRHHRDEVAARRLVHTLVPEPREILQALQQLGLPLVFRFDQRPLHRQRRRDVRPVGEFAPFLEREIEQRRQHLRRQFDRHAIDPVERLANGQRIQDLRRALADDRFHQRQIAGRDDRAHRLALHVVLRRVHGDERRPAHVRPRVADRDAAERRFRREHLVVRIDRHDVLILRHRPIRPELALPAPMHGIFRPQALEVGPMRVRAEQLRIAGVQVGKRRRISVPPRVLQ